MDHHIIEEDELENFDSLSISTDTSLNEEEPVTSYHEMKFESDDVKMIMKLQHGDDANKKYVPFPSYDAKNLFPDWMLASPDWAGVQEKTSGFQLSKILQLSHNQRSMEQVTLLINWLMSVWPVAETMGFKKCVQMAQSFKFFVYQAGDDIIIEGERGLTFYIIVSGVTSVYKAGVGIVAKLGE
jgi:hypothetical protein